MSMRKPIQRNRALRPGAESLEGRQLLSAVVSGTDIDGDQWVLQVVGPGSITVAKQNGADGNPAPLNSQSQIKSITIGGLDPQKSRVVSEVTKSETGDGKVFFESLDELPSRSLRSNSGNGPLAVLMPDFWLAKTTPLPEDGSAPTGPAPSISIPDGVSTLQFGGVDMTVGQPTNPTANTQSDNATITLGLPQYGGTRILIDKSISSVQVVPPSGDATQPTVIQHGVVFGVSGRLNLFQANEIVGDTTTPPGQFSHNTPAARGFGGTWVISGTSGVAPFLSDSRLTGAVTGQIGNVRVGGDATNFSTLVYDATGTGQAKLSNFSVGGETNNVLLVAPNGARNVVFGRGMDTVDIATHVINTLSANRGALNSTVYVDRTISKVSFGGDVVNTNVLSGYQQNFSDVISTVAGQAAVNTFNPTPQPAPLPMPANAQIGGGMGVLVAGDVVNSIFAASVHPEIRTGPNGNQIVEFGNDQNLVLPTGEIVGKVEGTINNSGVAPSSPMTAFFASKVDNDRGPVIPPNVPEAPYTGKQPYAFIPGMHNPARGVEVAARGGTSRIQPHRIGSRVPQGPTRR